MSLPQDATPTEPAALKQCCARLYESDAARWLLGDSFHPGGLRLTERLGELLALRAGSRVLDVAAGRGASALFLADRFGCEVIGVDYGRRNVEEANDSAAQRGLGALVRFQHGDGESLPFRDGSFDALICECAFCTFPDKRLAAQEFARVLRTGGRMGLSDVTRAGTLAEELDGLLGWMACIADAQPAEIYSEYLRAAGFAVGAPEWHDSALRDLVRDVQGKLLAVEVASALGRIEPPPLDLAAAKQIARCTSAAIASRQLRYVLLVGTR